MTIRVDFCHFRHHMKVMFYLNGHHSIIKDNLRMIGCGFDALVVPSRITNGYFRNNNKKTAETL